MMSPMIASAIAKRPPPPMPWMARKAISWGMSWARPQRAEPIRKMTIASWKISRLPYKSEILPQSGVTAVEVSR
jgi:hypothetical protein